MRIESVSIFIIYLKKALNISHSVKFSEIVSLPHNFAKKHIRKRVEKNISGKGKNLHVKNVQKNDMLRKKNHIRKRVAKKTYQEKAKIFTFFENYSQHVFEKSGDVLRIIFFFEKKYIKKNFFLFLQILYIIFCRLKCVFFIFFPTINRAYPI